MKAAECLDQHFVLQLQWIDVHACCASATSTKIMCACNCSKEWFKLKIMFIYLMFVYMYIFHVFYGGSHGRIADRLNVFRL